MGTSSHYSSSDNAPRSRRFSFKGLRIGTIRNRLLVAFVLLVLLPAAIISISVVSLELQNGQQQVINQLQSVATLKEEQIKTWLSHLHSHLAAVTSPYKATSLYDPLFTSEPDSPAYQQASDELLVQFEDLISTTELFEKIMLLNRQGRVLLSTDPSNIGQVSSSQEYFWRGLQGQFTQSLSSSTAQGLSSPVVVSQPVIQSDGTVRGVIVGWASAERLNAIMLQRAGLGETGETYLVGSNYLLLTDSRFEDRDEKILRLNTETIETVFAKQNNTAGLYTNYRDRPVVGVYRWLPTLQMVLVAEQEQAEAFYSTYFSLAINTLVAIGAVLLASLFALFIAQGIAAPLATLSETATRIAAGDLSLVAHIKHNDEVGVLARAFNYMTARLRQLIDNLEQTVAELRQHNLDMLLLNRLSSTIQACTDVTSAYETSVPLLRILFDERPGTLYRRTSTAPYLARVAEWGDGVLSQETPKYADCPVLHSEKFILQSPPHLSNECRVCMGDGTRTVLCLQLQAGGEHYGLLQVQLGDNESTSSYDRLSRLGNRAADLLALALSNLYLREHLRDQAIRDPLTGLFNRRFLNETLKQHLEHAHRHQDTLVLLLLDIDHFKHINDTYGHDAGDAVLRAVGTLLNTSFRTEDTVCRFGGEEMLVVLPGISQDVAHLRADELRQSIGALRIEYGHSVLNDITVSIGVSTFPTHGQSSDALITAADQALYRAKRSGRNRVIIAGDTLHQREVCTKSS